MHFYKQSFNAARNDNKTFVVKTADEVVEKSIEERKREKIPLTFIQNY